MDRTEELINLALAEAVRHEAETMRAQLARCESPIERLFLAEAMARGFRYATMTDFFACYDRTERAGIDKMHPFLHADDALGFLYVQPVIGKFRADFAVVADAVKAIVECDGHDFHERTKRQASRDKARDRWFQANGWLVFRFTGSDVVSDATACLEEVLSTVEKLDDDALRRLRSEQPR